MLYSSTGNNCSWWSFVIRVWEKEIIEPGDSGGTVKSFVHALNIVILLDQLVGVRKDSGLESN